MRDMDFTKDGVYYQRINKTKARRLYNEGKEIVLYPININPFSMWAYEFVGDNKLYNYSSFDNMVNEFENYNCVGELGRYTKFYIKNGGIK